MKRLLLAVMSSALLTSAAFSGSYSGVVVKYSKDHRTLTLTGGKSYTLSRGVAIPPQLAVGQTVLLTTDSDNPEQVEMINIVPSR